MHRPRHVLGVLLLTIAHAAGLIQQMIQALFGLGTLQFAITPNTDIALYPEHRRRTRNRRKALIALADAATCPAKQAGGRVRFFDTLAASNVVALRRIELSAWCHRAPTATGPAACPSPTTWEPRRANAPGRLRPASRGDQGAGCPPVTTLLRVTWSPHSR